MVGEREAMTDAPRTPKLSQHQRDLMAMGLCPFCEKRIKAWKPVFGSFAPEWWATVRESGRDPATGHAKDCPHPAVTL